MYKNIQNMKKYAQVCNKCARYADSVIQSFFLVPLIGLRERMKNIQNSKIIIENLFEVHYRLQLYAVLSEYLVNLLGRLSHTKKHQYAANGSSASKKIHDRNLSYDK